MNLPYALCGRCDQIDVVLDVRRPRCRHCDPRLAAYLAGPATAPVPRPEPEPAPAPPTELPRVLVPLDPTGRGWAA